MKPLHKPSVLLLAVVAALAAFGCGGGDSNDSTAGLTSEEEKGSLSKAELIERGDAICAEVNAALATLGREAAEAAVPDSVEKSTTLFIEMIEQLQDLGAPASDDGSYPKFIEAAKEFAGVEARLKLAIEQEESRKLGEAATEAAPALEKFREQAENYGFEECSKNAVAG